MLMGKVVFRGNNESAGVPVNAVDDTGALFAADAAQTVPTVVEQGVDQGASWACRFGGHA